MTSHEDTLPTLPPLKAETAALPAMAAFATVERIPKSARQVFSSRAEIPDFVEAPLVQAATEFFDRNIPTIESSAHGQGVDRAYIGIDFDALSSTNQRLVGQFMEADQWLPEEARRLTIITPTDHDPRARLMITMPLEGETPDTVGHFFASVAQHFEPQSLDWAGVEDSSVEHLEDYGYVRAEDGKLYPSAELATKQNAWLAQQEAGAGTT